MWIEFTWLRVGTAVGASEHGVGPLGLNRAQNSSTKDSASRG